MPTLVMVQGELVDSAPTGTVEISTLQLQEWKETAGAAAQRELLLRQQLVERETALQRLQATDTVTTPAAAPLAQSSFEALDLNHDGVIDRCEFAASASATTTVLPQHPPALRGACELREEARETILGTKVDSLLAPEPRHHPEPSILTGRRSNLRQRLTGPRRCCCSKMPPTRSTMS